MSDKNAEIYNVGSSQEISTIECANLIMSLMNSTGKLIFHKALDGSVDRRRPDISKLLKLVGNDWQFTRLDDGILKLIKWYNQDQNDEEYFR